MAWDILHENVRKALINDNWKITHDPYRISVEDVGYEVDLGAEKLIAATNGIDQILVEVKSFRGQSLTYEFHRALGQFNSWICELIQKTLEFYRVRILVFDPDLNLIVKWIKY